MKKIKVLTILCHVFAACIAGLISGIIFYRKGFCDAFDEFVQAGECKPSWMWLKIENVREKIHREK